MKFKIAIAAVIFIILIAILGSNERQDAPGTQVALSGTYPPDQTEGAGWAESIAGFSFDSAFDCDLNGDGDAEHVTFFTGQNQQDFDLGKIPTGWDLGAHTVVDGATLQVWFNVAGSTKSLQLYAFGNGKQGISVVASGNNKDKAFLLFYADNELWVLPR